MAPSSPVGATSGTTSTIPTAHDVTTSGGVWAPTSAKRDKLGELKATLAEKFKDQQPTPLFPPTLGDLATPAEQFDLWLVDGLQAIASAVDQENLIVNDNSDDSDIWKQVKSWMKDVYTEHQTTNPSLVLTQAQCGDYVQRFRREIERHLAAQLVQHNQQSPSHLLQQVRDYIHVQTYVDQLEDAPDETALPVPKEYDVVVERYRLLLAYEAAQVLLDSWKIVTTPSDYDIDRAAVEGVTLDATDPTTVTIPLVKLEALLESYLRGNATTRVDAWWSLMDKDDDGLLQESEMNAACDLAIAPVGQALESLLAEALEAHPVGRTALMADGAVPTKMGWRQRRQETRHKRQLTKMFTKTVKQHFVTEVEMPHRLRCIYAWANKGHQDNAIRSVMVDEIAWTAGRKRYVELPPKISLPEFREVQKEHFTHLDRVATEYLHSFREDLWILQGNKRQRAELIRDCALFMAVVCGVDYAIVVA